MYRPSLKSGWSLILLFVFSVVLFLVARFSYVTIKTKYYSQKIEAAKEMASFMDALKKDRIAKGIPIDPINDPLGTGLIGTMRSSVTTDRGLLGDKQTSLNPNLAAIFIEEFRKAGVKKGDRIAVGITGSNPATNLALYAAIKTLRLKPVIITSLSSASYGANQEDFTWLDMEAVLKSKGLIKFGCRYASLGGKDDLGVGLPEEGKSALVAAIERNKVKLIEGSTLEELVLQRKEIYNKSLPADQHYSLFVNIGRGLANVGSEPNANQITEGLNDKMAEEDYNPQGIMMIMAREGVPVFSMQHVQRWIKKYKLQNDTANLPKPGEGRAFSVKKHNVLIASICLGLLILAIIAVIILDRHDRHFMANIVDPDEEL